MSFVPIIVTAILVPFVLGFLWYGVLFKKPWVAATGMTDEKQKEGNMALIYGVSALLAIGFSMFLSYYVWHHEEPEFHTFKHGAFHGAILGLMVATPIAANIGLYEQKGWKYILINASYWIAVFAVIGGILNIWRM